MTEATGLAGRPAAGQASHWRPLRREDRQLAVLWGVLATSSLLLTPFWLAVAPLLPACPFRALTGLPCLSCGTTHAAIALLHGDLAGALRANPLAAAAGISFAAGGAIAPLWALASLPLPRLVVPAPRSLRLALVAALLSNWAWLIANR